MTTRTVLADLEIIRDAQGVPHIVADSAEGALFGQGYVCGVDRAWQIEFLRLRAEGRSAEVFGADGVGWDDFARRAQLDRAARRIYEASSPRSQGLIRAYVGGVNATLETAEAIELTELGHRPTASQPWTPVAIFLLHHILFGRFTTKLWRLHAARALGSQALTLFDCEGVDATSATVPDYPEEAFLTDLLSGFTEGVVPGTEAARESFGEPLSGSNAWGVAASRTATGAPLIAGDPHRFLELPGVYQQFHLACPEFDVVGFSFAGVPGVPHFCHSGTVAWGITNAMADYQDVYLERLSRSGTDVFAESVGGSRAAGVRREEILVRGGNPVEIEIITTDNGPVLFGGPEASFALSLRSPMLNDPEVTFDATLDVLFAKTVGDVEQAMRQWVEPVNRIVIADTSGRVTHHVVGKVPVRAHANYWLPVPGWDERYQWRGYVTPSVSDGVDASVADYSVIANQRIPDSLALQPVTTECAPPARAARIGELLDADPAVSVDGCERIHGDVANEQAELIRGLLPSLTGLSQAAAEVRRRLLAWDGAMRADSTDAYVFAEVRTRLVRAIARHEALAGLAEPHVFSRVLDPWFVVETRLAAALEAVLRLAPGIGVEVDRLVGEALEAVAVHLGELDTVPTWGSVHVLAPLHGMDLAGVSPKHPEMSAQVRPTRLPLGGDAECVFANASAIGFSHACSLGSAARYVWDLADRDASRWIVPLGVSGDPQSPNFEDQAPHWARGELIPIVSDWASLRESARRHEVFDRVHTAENDSVSAYQLARTDRPRSSGDPTLGEPFPNSHITKPRTSGWPRQGVRASRPKGSPRDPSTFAETGSFSMQFKRSGAFRVT
ncbi:penicillin acylase family protein [Nocardia sp. NPDC050175]|uniref:penicillin acylase family protein n=1 Tax=Nocardia sp. NPDC050175 TaxID=3364317 RepID=UPI0037896B08